MGYFINKLFHFFLPGLLLFAILLIGYFVLDPFKVIYNKTDYSSSSHVIPNRDYVSTQKFLNGKDEHKYDSFIFGSSRTLAYNPNVWMKEMGSEGSPFVFDASSESIYGIYTKIKFLDSMNVDINNALIIICRDYTFASASNPSNHLKIKHPLVSGESLMKFQLAFMKAYFDIKFLSSYYIYITTGYYFSFMHGFINQEKIESDPVTNFMQLIDAESMINSNPDQYYKNNKNKFYCTYDSRGLLIKEVILPKEELYENNNQIGDKQLVMLNEIKNILQKNNSNYRLVLHPLLDRKKFSKIDFKTLKDIFDLKLFDFTGKNEYTDSINNFYDWSHCRPLIGDRILESIYN